jgi:hypothetical protein
MVIILIRVKKNIGLFVAQKVTFKGNEEDFITERGTVFLNIAPPQSSIPTINFEYQFGSTLIEGMNLVVGNNPIIQTERIAFTQFETTFSKDVLQSELAIQHSLDRTDFHY